MAAPNNPHNRGKGAALQWLKAHVNYQGDDCLIWPFSRSRGHAHLSVDGKVIQGCRLMCELANGPPPTPKHECAHSCGRGHLGCINPIHLSWKTRSENQKDRRSHGTAGRAETNYKRFRLTPIDVAEIRALGASKSREEIGRMYQITPSHVAKIQNRERWRSGVYSVGGFTSETSRAARARRYGEESKHD